MSADKEEQRRERDRLRKRKKRDLTRVPDTAPEANDAGASTEMSADNADIRCNFLSLESGLSNRKEQKGQQVRKDYMGARVADRSRNSLDTKGTAVTTLEGTAVSAADKRRGTRILPDWRPSESDREFARNLGMSDPGIDALTAEFVDYWV